MIVFCEDCGKKNILNPIGFRTGKPGFRCTACGYLNPYYLQPEETLMIEKAEAVFEKISSFPEIIGYFIFHNQAGALKPHMPQVLKKADLDLLGKNLVEIFVSARSSIDSINEMVMAVADKNMIIKPMGGDLYMIIASKTTDLPHDLNKNFFQSPKDDGAGHKTD